MNATIIAEIERLRSLKAADLRNRYRDVIGEEPRSSNRDLLFRRIAWKLQADAEGGLSELARQRIAQLGDEAERMFRERPTSNRLAEASEQPKRRSPSRRALASLPVGTVLTRNLDRRQVVVTVLADGFEYQSRKYRSLSAIAREASGTQWNGPRFFGLVER